jgi:hypothetical protein
MAAVVRAASRPYFAPSQHNSGLVGRCVLCLNRKPMRVGRNAAAEWATLREWAEGREGGGQFPND